MPGHYGKMMKNKNGKNGKNGKQVMGKRKKLDVNKDGKLTGEDFAMLRSRKKNKKNKKTIA